MRHLEKRIAAVEGRDSNSNPTQFVWRNLGETPDEAITRTGGTLKDDVTVIGWHEQAEKSQS